MRYRCRETIWLSHPPAVIAGIAKPTSDRLLSTGVVQALRPPFGYKKRAIARLSRDRPLIVAIVQVVVGFYRAEDLIWGAFPRS